MGRCPEDQHAKVFFDAVKAMLDPGSHENEAAGFDRPILTRNSNRGAATDHVIDLILEVRPLAIGRSPRPDRQANAQPVRDDKVNVAMTVGVAGLRVELGNLVSFQCHLT